MKRKIIIGVFLGALAGLALVEVGLAWLVERAAGGAGMEAAWTNALAGGLLASAGAGLVIWSVWIQYTEGEGTPAPQAATRKLIVGGPYAYTRNPMTLGAALFYLGIAVGVGSGWAVGLVVVIFSALLSFIYVHETRELGERFGAAYERYRRETPFLIPSWRAARKNMRADSAAENR